MLKRKKNLREKIDMSLFKFLLLNFLFNDLYAVIFIRDDDFSERLHRSANFSGFTPLHYAALADSLECVHLLVDAGKFVKSQGHPMTVSS